MLLRLASSESIVKSSWIVDSGAVLYVTCYKIIITFVAYITKYAVKTNDITQVTLLTNVTRYLSNEVTVTSLILHNIITTSNKVTNLVGNPLSNT